MLFLEPIVRLCHMQTEENIDLHLQKRLTLICYTLNLQ